jgi:hypothetical protein
MNRAGYRLNFRGLGCPWAGLALSGSGHPLGWPYPVFWTLAGFFMGWAAMTIVLVERAGLAWPVLDMGCACDGRGL